MITPSFALTATERVLPKLALDFTTASLDSRVTFTRTTDATHPATYTNSSGVITAATNNQPRFDYDPVALTCKGLLIEESRANLYFPSNDFSGWSHTNVTVDTTAITAPDGTLTGNLFTTTGTGQVTKNYVATSTAHTFSLYIKQGTVPYTSNTFLLRNTTTATNLAQVTVTWSGTTFVSNIGTANTWTNVGNGWWRVTLSASSGITVGNTLTTYAMGSLAVGYNMYAWGNQLEVGAFATSYIPTTSASLTRNADVATMTGTNFSSWFNNAASSFDVSFIPVGTPTVDNGSFVNFTASGSNANAAYLYSLTNFAYFRIRSANVTQLTLNLNSSYVFVANQLTKLCAGWNATTLSTLAKDGTVSRSGSAALPIGINTVQFGYNVWIQKFNYFPQPFTVSETLAFSK